MVRINLEVMQVEVFQNLAKLREAFPAWAWVVYGVNRFIGCHRGRIVKVWWCGDVPQPWHVLHASNGLRLPPLKPDPQEVLIRRCSFAELVRFMGDCESCVQPSERMDSSD